MTRLGAWLGVATLLLQLLVPLSAPQAAWVEDGLFPPTCSVHMADDADVPAALADCAQCALCQLQAGDRLLPTPSRVVAVAYEAAAQPAEHCDPRHVLPGDAVASPPLPSRGPPPAA